MIDFKNPLAMVRSIARFGGETERRAKRQLQAPAEALLDEIKSQLQRPGGETEPVRYGRGRLGSGLRSRPGEAPRLQSGRLAASAHTEQPDTETQRVIVDAPYAAHLEFGTARMAPRPFMRPALAAARARMSNAFATSLRRGRG